MIEMCVESMVSCAADAVYSAEEPCVGGSFVSLLLLCSQLCIFTGSLKRSLSCESLFFILPAQWAGRSEPSNIRHSRYMQGFILFLGCPGPAAFNNDSDNNRDSPVLIQYKSNSIIKTVKSLVNVTQRRLNAFSSWVSGLDPSLTTTCPDTE